MTDAVIADRIQFAFTLMFHYLFPILTMGLAPLIVVLKTLHLLRRDEKYGAAARFWTRIFALNFAVGVMSSSRSPAPREAASAAPGPAPGSCTMRSVLLLYG